MIKKVEIKGFGLFEIKNDYLHLGISRLETYDSGRFKKIQFNSYIKDIEKAYPLRSPFQNGYDINGNEIEIKVIL